MLITLRKADENEAGEYLRIMQLVASPINYVAANLNEAQVALVNSTTKFIAADGRTIGLIAFQLKSPDHAYICEFAIDPTFQGQGMGSEAVSLLLKELGEVPTIDLATHPHNPARKLYERHGFKVARLVEDWEGHGPRLHFVLSR